MRRPSTYMVGACRNPKRLFISTKFGKFWIQGFLKEYLEVLYGILSFPPGNKWSNKEHNQGHKSNGEAKKEGPINRFLKLTCIVTKTLFTVHACRKVTQHHSFSCFEIRLVGAWLFGWSR